MNQQTYILTKMTKNGYQIGSIHNLAQEKKEREKKKSNHRVNWQLPRNSLTYNLISKFDQLSMHWQLGNNPEIPKRKYRRRSSIIMDFFRNIQAFKIKFLRMKEIQLLLSKFKLDVDNRKVKT